MKRAARRTVWASAVVGAITALALAVDAGPARGALPPPYGGVLRMPAPEPVVSLDPADADTPFRAALAAAVSEPLYRLDARGEPVPHVAASLPTREEDVWVVSLLPGAQRHRGTPVHPVSVAATLRRAAEGPAAAWLLSVVQREDGEPAITAHGEAAIAIRTDIPGPHLARLLAAAPTALATGRDPDRRPLGTGPFEAQFRPDGTLQLEPYAHSVSGAPYLGEIRVLPPRPREDTLRAFELGRLDASWQGESLYGGEPVREVTTTRGAAVAPVLLIPNRRSALAEDRVWAAVARAIDRRRLERVGLVPTDRLHPELPAPAVGSAGRPTDRLRFRMPVVAEDAFSVALAEALAAMLDEAGFDLHVDRVSAQRYEALVSSGRWHLRLATVVPPLPDRMALVGAALATTGQDALARDAAHHLTDEARATALARRLEGLVLGLRRPALSHRADLERVRFDALGRLDLGGLHYRREAP